MTNVSIKYCWAYSKTISSGYGRAILVSYMVQGYCCILNRSIYILVVIVQTLILFPFNNMEQRLIYSRRYIHAYLNELYNQTLCFTVCPFFRFFFFFIYIYSITNCCSNIYIKVEIEL